MYYVKTKATGPLVRAAMAGQGRVGARGKGVACALGSLVIAQRVARLLEGNGLLA